MSPKATVLMPVYNGEKYLSEAIKSILNQTFKNFEFLIIDDGSTDKTADIIKSFNDPRIKIETNENNRGLIYSLNKGIGLAQGEYIARMDADDISLPERLEKQIDFMDANQTIGVCGTFVKNIGDKNFVGEYYTQHNQIKAGLFFNSSLAHPSVIIRKSILQNNNLLYDEKFKHAEDYELWARAIELTDFANLPKMLLYYRGHEKNISKTNNETQKNNAKIIKLKQLKKISLEPAEHEFIIHNSILPPDNLNFCDFFDQAADWFDKINEANAKFNYTDNDSLKKIIYDRLLLIASANAKHGLTVWKNFYNSSIYKNNLNKNWQTIIKLFVKCLLKIN